MKSVSVAVAVAILLASPAFASTHHCMFRVHAEASERDSEAFAAAAKGKISGKEVIIEKAASISEDDVVAFTVYQGADGTLGALMLLDYHGRDILDSLSVERRGQHLFVFLNNRIVTEFLIDRRVSDGKIYIPSGITVADLRLMKKDWKLITPKDKGKK